MARLYLFAEGQTERTFADTILKPHLAIRDVYLEKPILIANARRKGKVHRGGGRNFKAMQDDIRRMLRRQSAKDVFFTSLIDLYALHKGFPGEEKAEQYGADPHKRVKVLETSWQQATDDERFIPHIQLHEYEAYLFSDISQLSFFCNDDAAIRSLQAIVDNAKSPELIDDGPRTAPSKQIIKHFPQYERAKAAIGPQVAERIGLMTIRSKCPHFDSWIARLEQLAS